MWYRGWVGRALIAGVTGGVILLTVLQGPARADDKDKKGLPRQIGIMEKVIDALLVDTPFVLVSGSDNARGLYLEGYGVVFSAQAALDFDEDWFKDDFDWKEWFEKEREKSGSDRHSIQHVRLEGIQKEMTQILIDYGPTLRGISDREKVGIALFLTGDIWGRDKNRVFLLEVSRRDLDEYSSGKLDEDEVTKRVTITDY
jgi:hypothetical protein